MAAMSTPARRARSLVGAMAIAAIAATLVVGPLALPSAAADYTANSEATWRAALVDAMANTGETNTITLTGDFAMSDPDGVWPEYSLVSQDLIIDGDGHTISAAPGNTAGFLFANAAGGNVTIQNVTIDGFTSDSAAGLEIDGTVTLNNVTVQNFDGGGSALYLQGFDVVVENSTFTDNAGGGYGGAVDAECESSLTVDNSTFTDNSTLPDDPAGGSGGALYSSCDMEVHDSTFTSNTALVDGGAVYASGYAYVYDSTFTGNSAGGDGGAFYVDESLFETHDSTFASNTAGNAGGAVNTYLWGDSYGSTWVGNEAAYGGAVYAVNNDEGSYTWIEESTYVDNYASVDGGAVYLEFSHVETYNSVFSGNEAGSDGAHIYINSEDLYTYATVFAGAVGADGCWAYGGVSSTGYNFDDDGTCTDGWSQEGDFGDVGENPMLGALADNGGPTRTRQPLAGSPLIDAIPWDACDDYAADANDQRGVWRSAAGAEEDGCDIGSVEVIKDLSFDIVGASGTTTVTVTGALDYDCDAWTPIAGYVPAPPVGVAFPHGVLSYCFGVPLDGWTVTVRLDLPSPVTQLWKETDGTWAQVPGAIISGTTITYDVTEGGPLDADGDANSYIVDPVAGGRGAGFTG